MTTNVDARLKNISRIYSPEVLQLIRAARILVVGAGGIGCELLKNLVLSGFSNIEILDLDTIDVSNLNRQFLFRREHVGQSKALIAKESVLQFNPHVQIEAIHDNIKADRFDNKYFGKFCIVMNALDNLEARRHVNRMCLATNRPLIESGTQGYKGQTTLIQKGKTACFECEPQPTPKTYAVCTIRNTPELPVHTIVWAKSIYQTLFGPMDEDNILSDMAIPLTSLSSTSPSIHACTFHIIDKYFNEDIRKLCEVRERWRNRREPVPLDVDGLLAQLNLTRSSPLSSYPSLSSYRHKEHTVLSLPEQLALLIRVVESIVRERGDLIGSMVFDKDDELAMLFVTLTSNLRMYNFHISLLSLFDIKGIAGNIVHAVATTNAIAAGLMVLDAIKVLRAQSHLCHLTWISSHPPHLLTPQPILPPFPSCYICGGRSMILRIDTKRVSVRQLFQRVLCGKLAMIEPSVDVINRDIFIGTMEDHQEDSDASDNEDSDNPDALPPYLDRVLSSPGVLINNGAIFQCTDQRQELSVQIQVVHAEWTEEERKQDEFELVGDLPPPDQPPPSASTPSSAASTFTSTAAVAAPAAVVAAVDDDDDMEVSDVPIANGNSGASTSAPPPSHKRKHEHSSNGHTAKHSKLNEKRHNGSKGGDKHNNVKEDVIELD